MTASGLATLSAFAAAGVPVASVSLFAPACTLEFAVDHYLPAIEQGILARDRLHIDNLSDARELDDNVGPYGKSLLYLVSRALEIVHKKPLLGMQVAWPGTRGGMSFEPGVRAELRVAEGLAHSFLRVRHCSRTGAFEFTAIADAIAAFIH